MSTAHPDRVPDYQGYYQILVGHNVTVGSELMKALLLMHSGALVAMLAFVGQLAPDQTGWALYASLSAFCFGAAMAVVTLFFSWLGFVKHVDYASELWNAWSRKEDPEKSNLDACDKVINRYYVEMITCGFISAFSFVVGVGCFATEFLLLLPPVR